jgi:hypothetical protein
MTTATYLGTSEDGHTLTAVTITNIDGEIIYLGYEHNAGSVDATRTLVNETDADDWIEWLTEQGYQPAETPWNVYTVEIVCDRGRWTYLASHNPAVALDEWARSQIVANSASATEPWMVRVNDATTGETVTTVAGGTI